jgi:hypothetical protein
MQCHALRDDEKMDLLYGEADAESVRRLNEHLASCASCRDEMAALRQVRTTLGEWKLPSSPAVRPPRTGWILPAAAAILLVAAGVIVLRGAEVRYEEGRLALRLGRSDSEIRRVLSEQEARHAREIQDLRASLGRAVPTATATHAAAVTPASLADVERLVREADARQTQRFLAQLEALKERTEADRRIDLARMSAGLSYLEGRTGQHLARTNELMNEMLRTSYER